jgi:tetratricopeptide (TPR) repeat protein
MGIAIVVAAPASVLAGAATVGDLNRDYYNPPSDGLLPAVERRHLIPGIQKMRNPALARFEAFDEFDFVLQAFPNHPRALDLMVQLCLSWGDKGPGPGPRKYCNLNAYFDKAIDVNPDAANTYVILGIYRLRVNQPKLAVESLKKALALDPASVNAHYNLGIAYFDLKEYALSNQHAQQAYALGAPLPGLQEKLKRVGRWDPSVRPAGPGAPKPSTQDEPPTPPK